MRTIYQPGDRLDLYGEPLMGRIVLWLRQFPKLTICASIFALGMLFCHVVKNGHEKGAAPNPTKGKPDTALSIVPTIEILKPSQPFIVDGFVPENSTDSAVVKYFKRFKDLAIEEAQRYGIPASVKMGQAILESDAGRSNLARKANNHFGMKCFSRTCKKGHCTNFGDDSHKDFFRKYGNAWESWRGHSKMLISGKYKVLLGEDYEGWAKGLKKLGYATATHYDKTLIDLIERFHLYDLDK